LGSTTGSGAPRFTSFTDGKSPIWNQYGHERMGWALSTSSTPQAPTPPPSRKGGSKRNGS
jgi:hypothetical protein